MKTIRIPNLLAAALACALAFATTGAQAEEINTRIGKLSFENGYPSKLWGWVLHLRQCVIARPLPIIDGAWRRLVFVAKLEYEAGLKGAVIG